MTPADFIALMQPALVPNVPDGPARPIVMAHAAYESGWGITTAFTVGNNPFNITRLPKDPRPVILAGDLEYDGSGAPPRKITQRFAKYESLVDAVQDYLHFIEAKRYTDAKPCLLAGDLAGFVSALSKGHYFTLPLNRYLTAMSSVHARVVRTLKETDNG